MPKFRSKWIWIALALIGILAAGLIASILSQRRVPPVKHEELDVRVSDSQDENTRLRPEIRPSAADKTLPPISFPLPALSAPLADIVETLRKRAALGDAGSACRLAAEYAYCSNLPRKLSEFERWLAQRQLGLKLIGDPNLHKEAEENIRRELPLRERGLNIVRTHCEGVDQISPADIAHNWLTAAKAGNLAAMKHFASGNAFRWDSLIDVLPELSEYRNVAEGMAIEVAKTGDLEMMLALASAYSPLKISSRNLLAQAIKPDRAKAMALYRFILAPRASDELQKSDDSKDDISDLIAELEALPGDEDESRSAELLANFRKNWHPSEPGPVDDNRNPRDGTVRDVDRSDCALD